MHTSDPPLVLVVDDDADSRTLLEIALSLAGYDVATAANGLDALDVARERQPRVILLDLAMPVRAGIEFRARQLRATALARIPVICVSGRHDAARASTQMHVAACIPKPFDLDDVLSHVRELLPGDARAPQA
jgi:DNA-binding response OmpR family regulator